MNKKIDELAVATIRSLCIDEINKAKSGHPGMALGSAPILYTLWTRHLVANPHEPSWFNRDRFVLSAGHASALLYALLHLSGYDLPMEELQKFRQIDSLTPGHPEYRWTAGVDATSGPLGQGIAQAVGMAMAEQSVQANYPDGKSIHDHYVYALCGDGCLQEGLSQEAISLAGHQKLNKLILFYDANQVTLDGALELSFSETVKNRLLASEWNVLEVKDGNDIEAIDKAIIEAKKSKEKPTMIIVHTVIGYGSKKQGTHSVHGSPLGIEDGHYAKTEVYGFDYPDFFIPEEVRQHFAETFVARGEKAYGENQSALKKYAEKHPEYADRFQYLIDLSVENYLPKVMPDFVAGSSTSSRVASGKALNAYMLSLPNLIGGSADVASSVMTKLEGGVNFTPDSRQGHNMNWGIREFAMSSAQNGMLLHGGLRTYVGCFLVFADYMKAAIRMAAISHLPAIYLFSHDSIAVGEDGPTHQPVEQLAMLRSIPNLRVIRPCDERETYAAWYQALASKKAPTALILSRQNLPLLEKSSAEGLSKGAYVVSGEQKEAELILIATGSEVSLAIEAQKKLREGGHDVRVVSMPSWELFEQQGKEYQKGILPLPLEKRVSIEMLSTFGWDRYAHYHMGIDTFGASAPAGDVIKKFDFTADHLVKMCSDIIG
ncbi:MAG TPA: transketolase [Bacilli bacterium]|nr:transketolase [Bacilli bacterium]HPS18704.1 transketolase [Bacilli bacterium]